MDKERQHITNPNPDTGRYIQIDHINIGAARSGTTSFINYLSQHPALHHSIIKEVLFFSVDEQYEQGAHFLNDFFETTSDVIYSTSDTYLLVATDAPKRLTDHNKNIKISIVCRDPVLRAYSSYHYAINNGHDRRGFSFHEALQAETDIIKNADLITINNLCHAYGSAYYMHLSRYAEYIDRENMHVITTSSLNTNLQDTMNGVFSFLNIPAFSVDEKVRDNRAAAAKNKGLHNFLINRDHPVRKILRKPLNIPSVKRWVLKSNIVDRIKDSNMSQIRYRSITADEYLRCYELLYKDLEKFQEWFQITIPLSPPDDVTL